ncbi:hydrogenase maturation protease [Mycobacterium sp. PSTR-4-N]|uniref:hydrogenase maturation protease n=1 Tax=Mycobacterium sp. PSTR-4-N TaxID=2917745 RepID=UPI001F1544F7|nr:hydrogenase maturation protease [Mycobacterium sp. PSTR-4-N]MCG7592607.1 hydrogenase maturation protease [Mycobacterium sp. PSTR-4-N]
MSAAVVGIGNGFRRDDGVGPVVAAAVARLEMSGVRVAVAQDDPAAILDAIGDVTLAVIVDAAAGDGAVPGRIRRWLPPQRPPTAVSSHGVDLAAVLALGRALGRAPAHTVVFTVDAADVGHGCGLSRAVAAAVPRVVGAVIYEIERRDIERDANDV